MITAEEFIEEKYADVPYELKDITDLMIEFAKLHVTEALKEASEKAVGLHCTDFVDKDSIINSYPLDNFK